MDLMFNKAQLAHGDFSEHNIIWHEGKPFAIDFLQSKIWHPNYNTEKKIKKREALHILKKDIEAVLNHFRKKYRVSYDPKIVFENMPDTLVDDWLPDTLLNDTDDSNEIVASAKRNL